MPRPRKETPVVDRHFAANLARARAALGWSCSELGRRTGLPPTVIWKTEAQGRKVSIGEAFALADALGVPIEALARPAASFNRETRLIVG